MKDSTAQQILDKIKSKKRGWVFTPKDFLELGKRSNIDFVLHQLTKQGVIRRLGRGIYDYPKTDSQLGTLTPTPDVVARAISVQTRESLQPSGAHAANMLGLSTQVPAKLVYMTSGKTRTRHVGQQTITLQHTTIPYIQYVSGIVNLTLQALLYLGKQHIDDNVIKQLDKKLSDEDKANLIKIMHQVPGWLAQILYELYKRQKNGQFHQTVGNRKS